MNLLLAALLLAAPPAKPMKRLPPEPAPAPGAPLTNTELSQALGNAHSSLTACATQANVKGKFSVTIEVLNDGSVKKIEFPNNPFSAEFTDCAKKVLGHLKLRGERTEGPRTGRNTYYLLTVPPPG